ncbi:elongation of very long chain fatty acids protein 1-like [Eupeodes corollae]|uniref:elongation of very long chain fatty acids protein 1-like n=1 Tax=Eupeodes corollae TaxID=290404 RepID=UPI002492B120|nr:elongation of very long chain fatty acids protein 1-like [Eupeodes corollae]XP_055920212.1 elongation of very long chain fatty acids protein 1-like [Eupeodes corollae]XP_055920213.1 elongation of very long chain fatty acids protein 1-like [Eupeodes corollae]XP_055920215.1 elongation of very long chain fatty acids protein 1-like [Eupeodes corollae]
MASEAAIDLLGNKTEMEEEFAINSPIPMIVILASYLLIILKIGPEIMKSRPAFQLKSYIVIYNILQVLCCIYLVYKIVVINLPTLTFWKCAYFQPGSIEEKDFNHISYFTFWLKASELSETIVFVLRKKQRQVSFLHVFHHCSTLFLVYQLSRNYKGSSALYSLFLNCNVHIFMYCYYLMAAVLPDKIVSKLTPVKKAITTIQMIQFALILLQVVVSLSKGCKVPPVVLSIYVLIISAFFYMFYDFYKKNYSSREPSTTKKSEKLN